MITKQAELLKKMEVVANWLDDSGFVKEASEMDEMMVKLAGLLTGLFESLWDTFPAACGVMKWSNESIYT